MIHMNAMYSNGTFKFVEGTESYLDDGINVGEECILKRPNLVSKDAIKKGRGVASRKVIKRRDWTHSQ